MSLLLPPVGSQAREMVGDIGHLAAVCAPGERGKLPTFSHGLRDIRCPVGARSVNVICLRANGDINLVAIGPRGSRRVVWNFGQ